MNPQERMLGIHSNTKDAKYQNGLSLLEFSFHDMMTIPLSQILQIRPQWPNPELM
jgi:hypothetical protein